MIEKDRKIQLPTARKIFRKISAPESEESVYSPPNDFKTLDYKPVAKLPALRPAKPKVSGARDQTYDHYIKVGYGNFASPLLQADVNLISDKSKIVRANLDHLSFGKGAVDGKNSASSLTEVGVNADFLSDEVIFSVGTDYTTTTDHFYGYQSGLEINQSDIRHKYDGFDISTRIKKISINSNLS